jgi:LytS/YehU family sensor histidine kinase
MAFYDAFNGHEAIYLFYLAVLIESIFFALGLGAKQRLLMSEKNRMQELAISGHKKNIELQNLIKKKMDSVIINKTKEIEALMKEKKEKEKSTIEAEHHRKTLDLRLRALQTQMNPHFLFNALNSIKHYIITNKKEDASFYLSKLSHLIRTILDNSQVRTISLNEELRTMQLYVDVENLRLSNPIKLTVNVKGNITGIKVPPLIMQPFIENAIWHGLALIKTNKQIHIEVIVKPKQLLISIEDNGIGRERAALIRAAKRTERKSLGITLTKERLMAFCLKGTVHPVIHYVDLYRDDEPVGTRVEITIPLNCFK